MVKADDKVQYGENDTEEFTEFEFLRKKVDVMQETIDEHAAILQQNDLVKTQKIEAPYVDDDEIFRRLEDEEC